MTKATEAARPDETGRGNETLNSQDSHKITTASELEAIFQRLAAMKVRYPGKFDVLKAMDEFRDP